MPAISWASVLVRSYSLGKSLSRRKPSSTTWPWVSPKTAHVET
jgi:hypothetical protein